MKFIRIDEYRISLKAIDYYSYNGSELFVFFCGRNLLSLDGDRAAALVKLLDEAIDGDNITDTVANAAASALLASLLEEKSEVAIDA